MPTFESMCSTLAFNEIFQSQLLPPLSILLLLLLERLRCCCRQQNVISWCTTRCCRWLNRRGSVPQCSRTSQRQGQLGTTKWWCRWLNSWGRWALLQPHFWETWTVGQHYNRWRRVFRSAVSFSPSPFWQPIGWCCCFLCFYRLCRGAPSMVIRVANVLPPVVLAALLISKV